MIIYIILVILIVLLILYIIRIKKELNNISKQIEESNGEYINVHTNALDNSIEQLGVKINYLYDKNQ